MAPRVSTPKPSEDTDTSTLDSALKPKTKRAKVEKTPKAEKVPKVVKPRAEKGKTETKIKPEAGASLGKGEIDGTGKLDKGKGKEKAKDDKPKDDKVEKVTGEEAAELILAYLKMQNRPYSVTDVCANLRGKVTKTVADKILKELENNGEIMGKGTKPKGKDGKDPAGTQWVFWCKQEASDNCSPADLTALDETISALRPALLNLKSQQKTLLSILSTLKSTPPTSALHPMISTLRLENDAKGEKLRGFQEGTVKIVSKEEMERVAKEWKYWDGKRKARKVAFGNLEAMLLERWGREEIWEMCGVEGDVEGS